MGTTRVFMGDRRGNNSATHEDEILKDFSRPKICPSRVILVRQSTTVPKTSKVNALMFTCVPACFHSLELHIEHGLSTSIGAYAISVMSKCFLRSKHFDMTDMAYAPDDVKKEAETLNTRWKDWVYVVPQYRIDSLGKKKSELIKFTKKTKSGKKTGG